MTRLGRQASNAARLRQIALATVIVANSSLFGLYVYLNVNNLEFALFNLFLSITMGVSLVWLGYATWRWFSRRGNSDISAEDMDSLDSARLLPLLNLSEHAHEGVALALAEPDGRRYTLRYVNTAFLRLLDERGQSMLGQPLDKFLVNREDMNFLHSLPEIFEAASRQTPVVVSFLRSTGEVCQLEVHGTSYQVGVQRWVVLFAQAPSKRSPKEQERAEEYTIRLEKMINERTAALLESERKYRLLLEGMDDIVVSLDDRGHFTFVNQAWDRRVGYSRETTIGHSCLEHMHPEDAPRVARLVSQAMTEKMNIARLEFRYHVASGEWRLFLGNMSLLRDLSDQILGAVLVWRDMTEQRRMEEHLTETQRLENVGLMASGLAHDFNNLFHEVIGFTRRIKRHPEAGEDIQRDAHAVEQVIERATTYVRNLLDFAGSGPRDEQLFDVNESIRRVHALVSRNFPKAIQLHLDLRAVRSIKGDPNQFDQVFLNLIINARDAMPQGGTITLRSFDQLRDESVPLSTPGHRQVVIEVEDNGTGVDPVARERIFDPFFTTKGPGKGSGLGLSTVLAIVKSHSGYIRFDSTPEVGTRFVIGLPAQSRDTQPQLAAAPDTRPENEPLAVLVVDDDREIRELTVEALQQEGFRVLSASGGHEAIETYQAFEAEVDIVVMDRMMPNMDGLSAIKRLRQINPECRVIISSGQALTPQEERLLDARLTRQLRKPYTLETLIQTLRALAIPGLSYRRKPRP